MKMRKIAPFIIALVLLLVSNTPASADIAPPEPAPGSGITPSQETRVRMVAENVLMVVREASSDAYAIEVTADFAMRNLGERDEQMQVRFPLENISGIDDGWGQPAEVRNFKARVNGFQSIIKTTEEPYQSNGIPINWAAFDVNFPTGQDVHIQVSYVTDVQEDIAPNIEYILGTGSGWFDSIGTATITIRFPYAMSTANILWFELPETLPDNVVTIGKEIRWHWENYEPAPDEIVRVSVVNPADWKQILDLESEIGIDPADVDTAIALSQAYQRVGSEKHGCMISKNLADLAEMAIEQSLPSRPNAIELHVQLAEVYYWRLNCRSLQSSDNQTIQKLLDELRIVLELDPTNERASEIQGVLQNSLTAPITPIPPTFPTKIAATKIATEITTEFKNLPAVTPTPSPEPVKKDNDLGFNVLWGAILFIIGIALGITFSKHKQNLI
jgi:hypothetical protein